MKEREKKGKPWRTGGEETLEEDDVFHTEEDDVFHMEEDDIFHTGGKGWRRKA